MYGNLISSVTQLVTPDIIGRMAQASGIDDPGIAQKAVGAAVPTLLSGLANLASKPDGARDLADTIAQQPSGMLDNLAGVLAGPGQLTEMGKTALTTIFGSSTQGALVSTLARYTGISEGSARSLLAMVVPLVLGVLKREAGAGASSVAQLLTSQKDNFAAAMPAGLSDMLKTTGLLGADSTVAPPVRRAGETYRGARDSADAMARSVTSPASDSSSSRWMYWALPLLVAAGLLWYLFGAERTTEPVAQVPPQARLATGDTAVGELQPQINALIESLTGTLAAIREGSPARDALPRLQRSQGELDRLTALANRLPVETRERLAEAIKAATVRARSALDDAGAAPQGAPETRPLLAALRAKLDALAMTPGSLAQQRGGLIADRVLYIARSPADTVWISAYFDRDVHNSAGEKIGAVQDLLVGPDARISAAVIGVGGFLGIGEKEVAVPFAAMQVVKSDNKWHLVVETTKEALKEAPAYQDKGDRVRLGPARQ
jgi:sporulation protein YlmC with PRC-barrel domain